MHRIRHLTNHFNTARSTRIGASDTNKKRNEEERIIISNKSDIIIRSINANEFKEANDLAISAFGWSDDFKMVMARKYYNEIYVAVYNDEIVGVMMAVHWGCYRVRGPLAVAPKYQRNGVHVLLRNHMKYYPYITHDVCATFTSTHHVKLYMRLGYEPRFLLYNTKFDIDRKYDTLKTNISTVLLKECRNKEADKLFIQKCRNLTNSVWNGLDLENEIKGFWKYGNIGSCYGLYHSSDLLGFAICSFGKMSEAKANSFKIKFCIAINKDMFIKLLYDLISVAKEMKFKTVSAGMNTGRINAFKTMIHGLGFEHDNNPMISMGKCIKNGGKYNDYNQSTSWIVGDWL